MKTARQKIAELHEMVKEFDGTISINTEIQMPDPDTVIAIARVSVYSVEAVVYSATGHKISYRKPEVNGIKDASFVSAAETSAIGRAISFIMPDNEIYSEEDFNELLVFTTAQIVELSKISSRAVKDYLAQIQNDELARRANIFWEALQTKTALDKI